MNREPMNGAEQNRSMKKQEENKKNGERNPNATSPFSFRGGIFFLVNFHEHFTLWTGRERARGEAEARGARGKRRYHHARLARSEGRSPRCPLSQTGWRHKAPPSNVV